MSIRPHCLPGTPRNPDGALPAKAWPADCDVQWGGGGVVFTQGGSYRTAFFEAFPADPATFIRGEGEDVLAAEAQAYAKFERILACPGHAFERRHFRNGAGVCRHCDLFMSGRFEPLPDPDTSSLIGSALSGDPDAVATIMSAIVQDPSVLD